MKYCFAKHKKSLVNARVNKFVRMNLIKKLFATHSGNRIEKQGDDFRRNEMFFFCEQMQQRN